MALTTGKALLSAVKASASSHEPMLSIPVGCPVEAILRPVATRQQSLNLKDVHALTNWRNRFVRSFLTEFEATQGRTTRWLIDSVGPDDTRILFMVDNAQTGQTFGYMGLAFIDWATGYGEADAVVRGESAPRGLMKRSFLTMLLWARDQLGLVKLGVRVRSDNTAIEFYRRVGFNEVRRVPLRAIRSEGLIQWTEDAQLLPGDPSLVHLELADDISIRATFRNAERL